MTKSGERRRLVPEEVKFATKPQRRTGDAGESTSGWSGVVSWVSGDTVYGNDRRLRGWLEENYQAYVLAVACTERVWIDGSEGPTQVAVEKVIAEQPSETWQRLS